MKTRLEIHDQMTEEFRDLALLYSLRMLDADDEARFAQHLETGCLLCAHEVEMLSDSVVAVAESAPQADPPKRLRGSLLEQIAPPKTVRRGEQIDWRSDAESTGLEFKPLYFDKSSGVSTMLVRMHPGAIYSAHAHSGMEHLYVISGELLFADHVLRSGDFEMAMPGIVHAEATTQTGCTVLVVKFGQ